MFCDDFLFKLYRLKLLIVEKNEIKLTGYRYLELLYVLLNLTEF